MQRLLLDTHTFLGWLNDAPQRGQEARSRIADAGHTVFVSVATGWVIGIKKALGKLHAPDDLDTVVEQEGFTHLPATFFHGEQASALPAIHRDPFDRMLVAQAQAEGLRIVTRDTPIKAYGIRTLDAEA